MGFLDRLLKTIGFEEDENKTYQEGVIKDKKRKDKEPNIHAKFDLKKQKNEVKKDDEELKEDARSDQQQYEIKSYAPKTQSEIEEIVSKLEMGESLIVNMSNFPENNRIRALDFISGAVFILKGKIRMLDKNTYLLDISSKRNN
jgi:FtsZ-interacting cell division protein YlmF